MVRIRESTGIAMTEITQVLAQLGHGDQNASEKLLPLIYDELRRLATRKRCAGRAHSSGHRD